MSPLGFWLPHVGGGVRSDANAFRMRVCQRLFVFANAQTTGFPSRILAFW
jgi:hypothetical protein